MWTRIRAVIVEDEPLAAEYLAVLLDETCQVEVVGRATESESGLRLCAELRPDAVFLDINLPGKDGVSLATQLAMLPQLPWLVFTTGNSARATDAFRLDAVDYLLKPLDPKQVAEAVNRLLAHMRPFESDPSPLSARVDSVTTTDKMHFNGSESDLVVDGMAQMEGLSGVGKGWHGVHREGTELLPVKDLDRDRTRLLARREIVAALRGDRRTWIHTVREEFATYYPLADVTRWLGGEPFVQIGRHAVVNLQAIEHVTHYGDRLYRVRLRDRVGTEITASRTGAARLAAVVKTQR
ncbi:MAG TPA: response regulator transcription factor [Chthoniobacterales bacterium]|jgi:two-component system, LytTR family, response regulator LytT|nr:response regulator transcription factor [Chthoniobacterales bacterium]